MTKKRNKLDRIQIPKPCSVGWQEMSGDDQIRFCNECNKRVYNLSAMTRRQAEAMLEASRGKLCARITRREDGSTVVASDPILAPTKLHHIRRASPIASAVVSAMMAVSPAIAAQTPSSANQPASVFLQDGQKRPGAQPQETTSALSGSVLDPQGAVIMNATVTLVNQNTGDMRGAMLKDDGTFQFDMLKPGSYSLKIEASGFVSAQTNINLQQNQQQSVNVPMQVLRYESMGGAVVVSRAQPLRTLYKESDLIVVATAGKSVKVESDRENSLMKTALQVFSTHKGKAKKSVVYVYHWDYRDGDGTFASDQKQLVFLKHSKEGKGGKDGYEIDDIGYGVKKLSDADLTIYMQRIAEQAKIMQAAKPDDAQIVEWLVRCAEEKATRFEGLAELSESFRQLRYQDEAKNEEEVEEEESEEVEAGVEADEEADETVEVEQEDQEYLKITSHLTQPQKERLLAILYNSEEISHEENRLIELAKDWKDTRLAPFLIAQMHRMEEAPTRFAETIIEHLVELLHNQEVEDAAAEYSDKVSYEDEDVSEEAERVKGKEPEFSKVVQERSEQLKIFLSVIEGKIKK